MYYNGKPWPPNVPSLTSRIYGNLDYSVDKDKNKEHNLSMKDDKRSDIQITSVQNGYVVSVDKTVYVFPNLPSAMDFLENSMPNPKEAKKFLDAQSPKKKQYDDLPLYGGLINEKDLYKPYHPNDYWKAEPNVGTITYSSHPEYTTDVTKPTKGFGAWIKNSLGVRSYK